MEKLCNLATAAPESHSGNLVRQIGREKMYINRFRMCSDVFHLILSVCGDQYQSE